MSLTKLNQLLLFCYFLTVFASSVCSNRQKLAYHATDTNYKQQKHLVELQITIRFENRREAEYGECSGSVISENWILSAAHCVKSDDIKAKIRDINVDVVRNQEDQLVTLGEVAKMNIRTHPGYKHLPSFHYKPENDLAVMKTVVPMKLYEYLMPIKLNSQSLGAWQIVPGIIAGYGETAPGVVESAPRQATVNVTVCSRGCYLLCSGGKVKVRSGDSGGLLVGEDGQLLGVTLSSCDFFFCQTTYLDVSYYLDWIKINTDVE